MPAYVDEHDNHDGEKRKMVLTTFAKWAGKFGIVTKLATRSFTNLDTNPIPAEWTHITKIDPEYEKKIPLLYPEYLQHTSAISVGGSRDVNSKNTEETFELLEVCDTPLFHEPSAARHVTPVTRENSEFLAIPEVLNGDSNSLIGTLGEGTEYLRNEMVPQLIREKLPWIPSLIEGDLADFVTSWLLNQAVFEAYIIQNENSAAAREANVTSEDVLSPTESAQRALAAEKHLESSIIYVEYSGTFGGENAQDILSAIDDELRWSRLWYGGGISNRTQATSVLRAGADSVIVGNVFHEIATDEAMIWEKARGNFGMGADVGQISNWVENEIDIKETSAYKFLSTIPQVDDPEKLSRTYLAKAVSIRHLIDEIDSGGSDRLPETELMAKLNRTLNFGNNDNTPPKEYLSYIGQYINSRADSSEGQSESVLSHIQGLGYD